MTEQVTEYRRKSPFAPLFEVGPAGHVYLNPRWGGAVSDFCEAVKAEVGTNPTVRCWPYRVGRVTCIAFDVTGDAGDVSLTMIERDAIEIPVQEKTLVSTDPECSVIDAVDAFYLASALLDALGLPSLIDGGAIFGPRIMAK